ncbi:SCP2 sterol-binding domain-containing protein [Salinithrix halophila]|uniref:SCP2 sterol-binding domain-containing protein n=1 Tax=Salinithrix halophila TaxID=1485204 RepID=A0ABV8JBH6_9BACL
MSLNRSTAEIFREIEARLQEDPQPIQGMETVYQFDLSGEEAGVFQMRLSGGKVEVKEEPAEKPNCTIQMTAADFKDMILGNLNATSAFMTGKLKVKGDLTQAMRLQSVLGQYDRSRYEG